MLRRGFPVEPANGPGFCEVAWDQIEEETQQQEQQQSQQQQQQQSIPGVLPPK